MIAISLCRAIVTAGHTEAHRQLFHEISNIVELDTGQPLHFQFVHGDGLEVITVDEHKGQAKGKDMFYLLILHNAIMSLIYEPFCLGLALFIHDISRNITRPDDTEPTKRICDLTVKEIQSRIIRLCVVHFRRNIQKAAAHVEPAVAQAMHQIASSESLDNFEEILDRIRHGGKKALGMFYLLSISLSPTDRHFASIIRLASR